MPEGVVRHCGACGQSDTAPHHFVSGLRVERQLATLSDGTSVPIDVPVDDSFHHECHARMGCQVCEAIIEASGGTTADGEVTVPPELVTIEPGEFDTDANGVLTRALTKEEAVAQREQADQANGFDTIPVDQADQLHADHAGGAL